MKAIVFITPGQPSSNPRLLKEAVACSKAGYKVTVLYNFWVQWASDGDKEIISNFPEIEWVKTGGDPVSSNVYFTVTRVRHKLFRTLYSLFPKSVFLAARAEIRGFHALLAAAEKRRADLYIAHNLGALPVAALAARKYKTKYAFDAEDFHRGQVAANTKEYHRVTALEDTFLPQAAYISAASPLIAQRYSHRYQRTVAVINNVFPKSGQPHFRDLAFDRLKMIWFSQTVGLNRGIQDAIEAANGTSETPIEITLVGLAGVTEETELQKLLPNKLHTLRFVKPLKEAELLALCSQHHIGLALERKEPVNRDLCLTNKVFTYLLAGNAIIASDTEAQKMFFEEHPDVAFVYQASHPETIKHILRKLIGNKELLNNTRKSSYQLAAQKLNWETEKQNFLSLVDSVLRPVAGRPV